MTNKSKSYEENDLLYEWNIQDLSYNLEKIIIKDNDIEIVKKWFEEKWEYIDKLEVEDIVNKIYQTVWDEMEVKEVLDKIWNSKEINKDIDKLFEIFE